MFAKTAATGIEITMVRYKVIQPSLIRFTTDNIDKSFDNGLELNTVAENIVKGSLSPAKIAIIRVFNLKGIYYTCDNRRLYVFRVAQCLGSLDYISVNVVSPCQFDLTVIKPGQDGKIIKFNDGSETYTHWQDSWGIPKVIDRQLSSKTSHPRDGASEEQFTAGHGCKKEKTRVTKRSDSEESLINQDSSGPVFCCCIFIAQDDSEDP